MKYLAVLIAIGLSCVWGWNENVFKFSVEEVNNRKFDLLQKLLFRTKFGHGAKLQSYHYKNCGNTSEELAALSTLVFGPDPLSLPGDLTVEFQGVINSTLDAPLAANLLIEKKLGSSWIKIPCIGIIGSCHYPDLCDILAGATCPQPFVDNKIPCKCPFPKGAYHLPKTTFEVDAAVFPPGDYHAQANVTYGKHFVTCVDLMVTFA